MEKTEPWAGRWVVVCGGTSGLGLQLVIAAAKQKAKIAIVGRDMTRLESAKNVAIEAGALDVVAFSIDLGLPTAIQSATSINSAAYSTPISDHLEGVNHTGQSDPSCDRFHSDAQTAKIRDWLESNHVDILINAIGRSDRGLLEQLADTDMASLFNDNVLCTWNMTRMSLDSIKRARGTIVNIGSLAGIVPAPGMGGYSIAKSALTAMTRQLRLELANDGVHVMLVCPGPIAREDSGARYQKIAAQRGLNDPSSSAPGGGVKIRLLDPVVLCNKILVAAHKRQKELITPSKASWLAAIASLSPNLADWILRKYLRTSSS